MTNHTPKGIDDALSLINSGSATPIAPKKITVKPLIKREVATQAVKETAIALIESTFTTSKGRQAALKDKLEGLKPTHTAVYQAFTEFESALGGRTKLLEVLRHCPANSLAYGMVQKLMTDPSMLKMASEAGVDPRHPLAELCAGHKIPFSAIVAAFKDSVTAQMTIQTLTQVSSEVAPVVEQVVEDSKNRWVPCEDCDGVGRQDKLGENGEFVLDDFGTRLTHICYNCRGRGRKFQRHDVTNRKMLLQMAKIIEQKALVENNINTNVNNMSASFVPGDGSFERLMKAVDQALTPKSLRDSTSDAGEVVDVEVIDSKGSQVLVDEGFERKEAVKGVDDVQEVNDESSVDEGP